MAVDEKVLSVQRDGLILRTRNGYFAVQRKRALAAHLMVVCAFSLVEPPGFCPVAAVAHIAPLTAPVPALVIEQPTASVPFTYPNSVQI
jgi:hypothetical protein